MKQKFFSRIGKGISIVIGAVLLLFMFSFTQILEPAYGVIRYALSPLQKHMHTIGATLDHIFMDPQQKEKIQQVERYEQRIADLEVENAKLKVMIGEATVLAEQLTFLKEEYEKRDYVIAHVVSKEAHNTPMIMINKGSNDGIEIGYPVITQRGVLVGKVIEVYSTTSQVMLLTHNQSHVAATILHGEEEHAGIVSGDFQLSMMMEFVPKHVSIELDDVIITSGLENYTPKGLVIGRVREVTDIPTNVFKEITVDPLIASDKLTIVSVLKP